MRRGKGKQPRARPTPEVAPTGKLDSMFSQYSSNGETIDSEGIGKLVGALKVDPLTDLSVLVFLWKCGITEAGTIKKEEFLRGMNRVPASSLETLMKKLAEMRGFARSPARGDYMLFFRFVFDISREPGYRVLEVAAVSQLLSLLLGDQFIWVGPFLSFLQTKNVKALNQDQWTSFLEFCLENPDSVERYNADGPWPLLIDEFVSTLNT